MAHAKPYLKIGAWLFILTAVTVALAYVDFGTHARNVVVALLVATFKVCLVGAVFMHLKGESMTVWRPLYFTVFFVIGLFVLSLLAFFDPIATTIHATH